MPGIIGLQFKIRAFMIALNAAGAKLQNVAADTLNESAEGLAEDYKVRLKRNQIIRAPFTLNAVKVFKATPTRSTGEPRPLGKINAIAGVRKMRGGKDHYLYRLEVGERNDGNPKTGNKVPVPLDPSRTGRSPRKPIARGNRILGNTDTQTLQVRGQNIGVSGDRFNNPRRRWGALYGAKAGRAPITGNLSRPFFFIDNQNRLGIFKFFGRVARKIRILEDSSIKPPPAPNFDRAVDAVKPSLIQARFVRKARAAIRNR